jgi:protein TonB
MNKSETTSWDEIVFEYRNKEYGAYPLRYSYPNIVSVSAVIVISVFLATMIGRQILKEEIAQREKTVKVIHYTELEQPPPIERIEVQAPKVAARYEAPKVVAEEPEEEQDFMTINEVRGMLDAMPEEIPTGNETAQEVVEVIEVIPPPEPVPEPEPEPVIIIKPPEFPGGVEALQKWMGRHLEYPSMAVRMGIEGSVVVEFTVDVDGKISDITVVKTLHKLCDKEAIRLVKSMPDWTPGNAGSGVKVTATVTLPIRFILN